MLIFVNAVATGKWWIKWFPLATLEISVCIHTLAAWQRGEIWTVLIPAPLLTCSLAVIHLVIKY